MAIQGLRPLLLLLSGALLLGSASAVQARRQCATTISELRVLAADPLFPLHWREVSMTDGKPLMVSITEREGAVFLEFVKTQEGLWAEGPAAICLSNTDLEARMPGGRLRLGSAAHWLLRHSMGRGAVFALSVTAPGQLRISTPGWSGTFTALP
jgi:hypothetical protein